MVFGQHLKLAEGRTSPVYRTQQNGNDASIACLVSFDGPLDFEVVAGQIQKSMKKLQKKAWKLLFRG
jgi:hypothetical protein